MTLLGWMSYGAAVASFLFITLALAQSLLTIAEIIEEHSRAAKIVGQRGIYVIIILHVLLYFFDSLPFTHVAFSIACHLVYLQNFATWPFISLSSISFITSCALVVANHFLWFFYWAQKSQESRQRAMPRRVYKPVPDTEGAGFAEIATFFGTCVWLVPLFLFLSLSANDNALPTRQGDPGTPVISVDFASHQASRIPGVRSSLFKSVFDPILQSSALRGIRQLSSRRDTTDGIIAPRSPLPPQSPGNSWTFAGDNGSRPPSPAWSTNPPQGLGFGDLGPRKGSVAVKLAAPPRRATNDGIALRVGSTARSSLSEESEGGPLRPSSRLGRVASMSKDQ